MPDLVLSWPVAALQRDLRAVEPELRVQVVARTGSTNSALMDAVRADHARPTLLVAEVQTAGRGRMGRAWQQGAPGAALSFSLALPLAPVNWSGLSLAVGVAVAESLHPDIRLKWPNDLWWHERKLAGILMETTAGCAVPAAATLRWVVIGVGINVQLPQLEQPVSTAPASLCDILGVIAAPAVLQRVALPLLRAVKCFERRGFAPFAAAFARRDALANRPVWLSDGTEGLACGVDANGALQVRTRSGLQHVRSLEVSVRPKDVPAS